MADFKTSAGYTSASGSDGGLFIVHTPLWCTIVRGFQAFFGFLILILSGLLIHGLALDAIVFALVCVCRPRSPVCGLLSSRLTWRRVRVSSQ